MTADLASCLLAAIEETERIAQKAADFRPHPSERDWRPDWRPSPARLAVRAGNYPVADYIDRDSGYAEHIARQDPKSTLRHCAADRKIIERHVKTTEMWDQGGGPFTLDICQTCAYGASCGHCLDRNDLPSFAWPCPTLRDLAEVYGLTTVEVDDECE